MSRQLSLSATLSLFAMAAMAIAMTLTEPSNGGAPRGATAQGSLVGVLLRA